MKTFVRQHLKLEQLSRSSKLTYTIFLAFGVLGLASSIALGGMKTHFTYAGLVAYYRGDEALGYYAKTPLELLETTHFHLFSQPVFFFIIGHIFLLSAWPRPLKAAIVCASFAAVAADIAGPWLIVYAGAPFTALKLLAGYVLAGCFVVETLVALYDMWRRRPHRSG